MGYVFDSSPMGAYLQLISARPGKEESDLVHETIHFILFVITNYNKFALRRSLKTLYKIFCHVMYQTEVTKWSRICHQPSSVVSDQRFAVIVLSLIQFV